MAMWSITTLVAPVTGPLLGGWITDNLSWPWIFYINIPVGLLSAAASWTLYRQRETVKRQLPIDSVGLALLVLWVGSLQIMLDKGKELDWFHSTEVVTLGVVAAVGFVFFLAWELTEDHPVVDLTLFKSRNFWAGACATAIAYGLFFGNVVLLPLWLQQYMGYTATWAGMVMAGVGLMAILLSPVVGKNLTRVDPRKFVTFSFVVFAGVLWMRSWFSTQTDFVTILIPTVIQGVGMAFFFIPLVSITLSGISPDRIAAASGVSNFMRITAGAFGTSITTTLWEDRAKLHHAHMVELISSGRESTTAALNGLSTLGLSPPQAMGVVNRVMDEQAFTLAATDIFYASAWMFVALIPFVWITRPKRVG
jgi:DHA2 family multidrug resistance protein